MTKETCANWRSFANSGIERVECPTVKIGGSVGTKP